MTSTQSIIKNIEGKILKLRSDLNKIPKTVENIKLRSPMMDKLQALEMELAREKSTLMHEKKDSAKRKIKSLSSRGVSGGGGMMTTFKKGKSLIEKMKDL